VGAAAGAGSGAAGEAGGGTGGAGAGAGTAVARVFLTLAFSFFRFRYCFRRFLLTTLLVCLLITAFTSPTRFDCLADYDDLAERIQPKR